MGETKEQILSKYSHRYRARGYQKPKEMRMLPFTDSADVREKGWQFLCVPQDLIHRIVTLQTSGTTGEKKRIYFTEEDQERTIDFFHHGMTSLAQSGDRILILMPGERPGSVGDLLKKGVERFGAYGIIYGAVEDPKGLGCFRERIHRYTCRNSTASICCCKIWYSN